MHLLVVWIVDVVWVIEEEGRKEGRKERVPVRDDFLLDCSKGFTEPLSDRL